MSDPLVRLTGLAKVFKTRHGLLRAVDSVDLEIERGSTLALVGESGSGKSTLGRCVLQLLRSSEGVVEVDGQDVGRLGRRELRRFRKDAQMVFQDPYGSLNPRLRVRQMLLEPLKLHTDLTHSQAMEKVSETLRLVHLDESYADRFPGQLSGGEQQRVGIARAVISEPKLIVLDEPTASLDARVRKGIYELLADLQTRMGLTYLLISHDLSSVWSVSDRVAVMYMGQIVEEGATDEVFLAPGHPYTVALMSAAPQITLPGSGRSKRLVLPGETGGSGGLGCQFRERCSLAVARCGEERPALRAIEGDHLAACFRLEDVPTELAAFRGTSHLSSSGGAPV